MDSYGAAKLIYVGQTVNEAGSPVELTIEKQCQVKQVSQFSLNYYMHTEITQRLMRKSKNLVVSKTLTNDIVKDGIRYTLFYVEFEGVRYKVHQVLRYYKSSLRALLDCQEVR